MSRATPPVHDPARPAGAGAAAPDRALARDTAFWTRLSARYAATPLKRPELWQALLDRVAAELAPDARVMELGCGTGTAALALAPGVAAYTAVDISAGMIAQAEARRAAAGGGGSGLRFVVSALDAGLPEGPFDAILAFNLLHLVPERAATLARLRDRLRPGGVFISKTPCLGRKPHLSAAVAVMRMFGKAPRLWTFTAPALAAEIAASGLEVTEDSAFPEGSVNRLILARRPDGDGGAPRPRL